ncbi:MAG: nitroreductase/quinone reductase family protein [Candidatus Bathyarchaeota archaeon]
MNTSEVANEKYIYLSTKGRRTGKQHTVELWFAVGKRKIYLSHEGEYTDWMKNILKDSRIKFRVRRRQFEGEARIINDGGTFETGKHALYLKYYGKASENVIDDWFSESTVIEITIIEKR